MRDLESGEALHELPGNEEITFSGEFYDGGERLAYWRSDTKSVQIVAVDGWSCRALEYVTGTWHFCTCRRVVASTRWSASGAAMTLRSCTSSLARSRPGASASVR